MRINNWLPDLFAPMPRRRHIRTNIPHDPAAGELLEQRTLLAGHVMFSAPQDFSVGDSPVSVAAADFDGDGVSDLVTANLNNSNVSVLLGNGDGTFQPAQNFSVGASAPNSVTTADFNGDGITDLATGNFNGRSISVLLGNGDGTFLAAQTYFVSGRASSVTAADLNGDGVIDLASTSDDKLAVLLGKGDGSFQTPQRFAVGTKPTSLAAEDFDGDGNSDLVAASQFSDNIWVLPGNGDGTFQASQVVAAGNSPRSVTTEDFDGDGNADIAVANFVTHNVAVLLGNGDGSFQAAQQFSAGANPGSLALADFDGDGLTDFVTTNGSINRATILLGNGDGTFLTFSSFFTGGGFPASATTSDFNGDGVTDLATANRLADEVNVLLGQQITNQPPVVSDFTKTGTEDSSMAFAAADFVSQFSDLDGDTLVSVRIDSLPANGVLELTGIPVSAGSIIAAADLGSLAFAPNLNFNGQSSFDYSASDGTEFSATSATVTLDVLPVNDAPTVSGPVAITSDEDTAAVNVNLLAGASDVDTGNTLNVANLMLTGGDDSGVTVNGNSLDVDPSAYNHLAVGETEVISYAYDVDDGNGGSVPQTATITIEGRNDAPTGADFTKTGTEDSPLTLSAADFVAAFSDPDTSDTLQFVRIDALPADGMLELNGAAVTAGQAIGVADLDNLVFVPHLNFNGETTLTYSAGDGTDFSAVPATVTLDILSAAEQVDLISAKIDEQLAAGVINEGQAESLTFMLKDNNGDAGKVRAFLNELDAYILGGILTEEQAEELIIRGNLLLVSLETS